MVQKPRRMTIRRRLARLAALFVIVLMILAGYVYIGMVWMPGESYEGPLLKLTDAQGELAEELRGHVSVLGGEIGARNIMYPQAYARARQYLVDQLRGYGYEVVEQTFVVGGVECANIIVEIGGSGGGEKSGGGDGGGETRGSEDSATAWGEGENSGGEIIVVGAHYDGVDSCPAANDNGSGCAATLALAKRFVGSSPRRTIRFVLFANEEPPQFKTDDMGSVVYARSCKNNGDDIAAMLSLETIGYYSDAPNSQRYPVKPLEWFYPTQGNFISFVGNMGSRSLTRQVVGSFRKNAKFPSQGTALPGWIPGVGWSDQWAFWQEGYPGVMVTDTAPYRYAHYHKKTDTPDKLDYERMARVVEGLEAVIWELAGGLEADGGQ